MKLYMFRTFPLSTIRSFSLYTQQWYMSYSFADSLRAGSGCSILILCPPSGVFHCTHSNGTYHTVLLTACEQDQDVPSWSCSQAVSKPVWHIPLLCVQWKTPDDRQRKCPKHVEFHSKNKFEKLVYLVGFIIRNLTRCTVTWTSNWLVFFNLLRSIWVRIKILSCKLKFIEWNIYMCVCACERERERDKLGGKASGTWHHVAIEGTSISRRNSNTGSSKMF